MERCFSCPISEATGHQCPLVCHQKLVVDNVIYIYDSPSSARDELTFPRAFYRKITRFSSCAFDEVTKLYCAERHAPMDDTAYAVDARPLPQPAPVVECEHGIPLRFHTFSGLHFYFQRHLLIEIGVHFWRCCKVFLQHRRRLGTTLPLLKFDVKVTGEHLVDAREFLIAASASTPGDEAEVSPRATAETYVLPPPLSIHASLRTGNFAILIFEFWWGVIVASTWQTK